MAITSAIMAAPDKNVEAFRASLLKWYDRHRRVLPWRALKGRKADPYHVWLSEIMLQQTTVPAVVPYFLKFLDKWPTVHDLARAESEEVMQNWAGLGYYARARNLHKCAQYVSGTLNGKFPSSLDKLKELPGVGDYTSAAISAIAFNKPANVVDGNVERVMARIFAVTQPVPDSKPLLKQLAATMAEGETARPGDYAQALMDLGATICTPSSPKCMLCPVRDFCDGLEQGIAAGLPARKAKTQKPQKHGYVYWLTDAKGCILFEKRGEKGMLGGTIGLPTSAWLDIALEKTHLADTIQGKKSRVLIRHSFTHFDLELEGITATVGEKSALPKGGNYFWVPPEQAETLGIPTLFKKALKQFI
jgi:A/G-specific adenine glycosylase